MKKNTVSEFAQLLKPKDYKRVEWKNKGGSSEEIAIFPPQSKTDNDSFQWRLSAAHLSEKKGSFSEFPECDRFLTMIEGKPFELLLKKAGRRIPVRKGEVTLFSGDETTEYELGQPPAKDLGLIFKRKKVKAAFDILTLSSKPKSFQVSAKTTFFFMLSGSLTASVYPGEVQFTLQAGDTLRVNLYPENASEERFVLVEPKEKESHLVAIELDY